MKNINNKKQNKSLKSLEKGDIEEIATKLSKSMYKAVIKAIHDKEEAKEIVEDILDPDYEAEVDPDKIPSGRKVNVVNKSEKNKSLKSLDRLRVFLNRKSGNNSNL